jgi:hypothetical protein
MFVLGIDKNKTDWLIVYLSSERLLILYRRYRYGKVT